MSAGLAIAPEIPALLPPAERSIASRRRELRRLARAGPADGKSRPHSVQDDDRIRRQLIGGKRGVVCSEPWASACVAIIVRFQTMPASAEAAAVASGIYPPGGLATPAEPWRMHRCSCCDRRSPRARFGRLRTAEPLDDGSVRVTYTRWRPVCIDCFYNRMPLEEVVQIPSSPGFSTRIPDGEMTPQYPFQRRSKRARWRFDQ